jgi:hypothetical protein
MRHFSLFLFAVVTQFRRPQAKVGFSLLISEGQRKREEVLAFNEQRLWHHVIKIQTRNKHQGANDNQRQSTTINNNNNNNNQQQSTTINNNQQQSTTKTTTKTTTITTITTTTTQRH